MEQTASGSLLSKGTKKRIVQKAHKHTVVLQVLVKMNNPYTISTYK